MGKVKFYFFIFLALPNHALAQFILPNSVSDKGISKKSVAQHYFKFLVSNDQRILRGRNINSGEEFKLISEQSSDFEVATGLKNKGHTYELAFRKTAWRWKRSTVNNLAKYGTERNIYSLSYLQKFRPRNQIFIRLNFQEETFYANPDDTIGPRNTFYIIPQIGLRFYFNLDKKTDLESSHLVGVGIYGRMSGNPVGKSFSLGNSMKILRKFAWGKAGAGLFVNNSELRFFPYENKHSDAGISLNLEFDF